LSKPQLFLLNLRKKQAWRNLDIHLALLSYHPNVTPYSRKIDASTAVIQADYRQLLPWATVAMVECSYRALISPNDFAGLILEAKIL
jgi:hypothetical protein